MYKRLLKFPVHEHCCQIQAVNVGNCAEQHNCGITSANKGETLFVSDRRYVTIVEFGNLHFHSELKLLVSPSLRLDAHWWYSTARDPLASIEVHINGKYTAV